MSIITHCPHCHKQLMTDECIEKERERGITRSRRHYQNNPEQYAQYRKENKYRNRALGKFWRMGLSWNEEIMQGMIAYEKTREDMKNENKRSRS